MQDPGRYVPLWLFASTFSTKFTLLGEKAVTPTKAAPSASTPTSSAKYSVVASPTLFNEICQDYVENHWEIPRLSKQFDQNRMLILDEIQLFGREEKLKELVEILVAMNTRMTVIVGALCFLFTQFKSCFRVWDCKYVSPNIQDMKAIYGQHFSHIDPTYEDISLPSLYGGLVRPLVNTPVNLYVNNNPIDKMESTITPLYGQPPLFLLQAVFADVLCLRDKVSDALRDAGSMTIGALELKEVTHNTCKFSIAPILLSFLASKKSTKLPNVPDPRSCQKFKDVVRKFINPSWKDFEDLTVVASALRVAALSNTKSILWKRSETFPLQTVFSSRHTNCRTKDLLSSTKIDTDLQVHWFDGGDKYDQINFSEIKRLALEKKIVAITMTRVSRPHPPVFDNYLAIPTIGSNAVLLVAIESKYSKKGNDTYVDATDILKKTTQIKAWIPKDWSHLLVFSTNRNISETIATMLATTLRNENIVCSHNLANLFGSCLVPPLYRDESDF